MKIPYGMSNFAEIRREGRFYADKTELIPVLEDPDLGNSYLFLLRPRRFGKSLLISMLEHYYDIAQAARFDELFSGLAIHQRPTPLRNAFLVLTFDFSTIETDSGIDALRETFFDTIRARIREFLIRYQDQVPEYLSLLGRLDQIDKPTGMMVALFSATRSAGRQIYVLIDEYDGFANELLSRRQMDLYHEIFEGPGFVRTFFKTIKDATRSGPVTRLLATGVSPVMLDDMASGFNITAQITMDPRLQSLCGFTRAEVELAVASFIARTPEFAPKEAIVEDLGRYYDAYRFAEGVTEPVYNPDMVLYFLMEMRRKRRYPKELIDVNVRTDYGKLRLLATPHGGSQDWHKELWESLLSDGQVISPIVERFGARQLFERQHLISLLFYMGLLTIGGVAEGNRLRLEIPNLVVRLMHWEEMGFILRTQGGAMVDTTFLADAVAQMAYHGDIAPLLKLLHENVFQALSNRDLIQFDEKHCKLILLTYLALSPVFRPLSEKEFAQGYGDLFLALDRRFPDARYAYLIELKYLKSGATDAEIAATRQQAEQQLARYLSDEALVPALKGGEGRTVQAVTLIFIGASDYRHYSR